MKYIIKVTDAQHLASVLADAGITSITTYAFIPDMAAGELSSDTVIALLQDIRVKYVEPDIKISRLCALPENSPSTLMTPNNHPSGDSIDNGINGTYFSKPALSYSWHQSYINRRYPNPNISDVDGTFSTSRSGVGVNVYVVDTGIRYSHIDFLNASGTASRASALPGYTDPYGDDGADQQGHGTHVAGISCGKYSGFARDANVFSARIFGPIGDWAGDAEFLDICDKIIAHKTSTGKPAVANMSLGQSVQEVYNSTTGQYTVWAPYENPSVSGDSAMADGVHALVAAGVVVVVSAGNGWEDTTRTQYQSLGINSSLTLPASVAECITVGALTSTSNIAYFSNYGSCVDVFAPGYAVVSASVDGDDLAKTMSGTSMSAPCVTGLCAMYLEENPTATPNEVANWLRSKASSVNILSRTNLISHTNDDPFIKNNLTSELRWWNGQPVSYPPDYRSPDRVLFNPYTLKRSSS